MKIVMLGTDRSSGGARQRMDRGANCESNIGDLGVTINKDMNICGHCDEKVTDRGKGSDGLYCDYCCCWVHASCEGMSLDMYKLYSKVAQGVPNMSYYCTLNHCKLVSGEILKQLGPIRQKVDENSQRIRALEEAVQKQESVIESKIEKEIEDTVTGTIEEKVKNAWETERDRTARMKNIIFANLKEAESRIYEDRNKHDKECILKLMKDYMDINKETVEDKIMYMFRLGKQGSTTGPRLLKVCFDHESTANKVLRAAPKLDKSGNEEVRRIKVFRDMCQVDREKRRVLVNDARNKNDELQRDNVSDFKWIIRGERVVKVKVNPGIERKENFLK